LQAWADTVAFVKIDFDAGKGKLLGKAIILDWSNLDCDKSKAGRPNMKD